MDEMDDDLIVQIEQLEIENKRLTSQLKIANREIDRCWKMINRYEKMIDDEVEHIGKCVKDMKKYSNNIQELYAQRK